MQGADTDMSKRRIAKELLWTVYDMDDPDKVYGENLKGKECDALVKRLEKRCINAAAIATVVC